MNSFKFPTAGGGESSSEEEEVTKTAEPPRQQLLTVQARESLINRERKRGKSSFGLSPARNAGEIQKPASPRSRRVSQFCGAKDKRELDRRGFTKGVRKKSLSSCSSQESKEAEDEEEKKVIVQTPSTQSTATTRKFDDYIEALSADPRVLEAYTKEFSEILGILATHDLQRFSDE